MAGEGNSVPQEWDGNGRQKLKSVDAELHSYVTFYNRTSRTVDILWCNYSGLEVMYKTLKPKLLTGLSEADSPTGRGQYFSYSVDTYVSHPWIARDSSTGHLLRVNQRRYFLPAAYDGEEFRIAVNVDIPVFSLKDRCLEEVRKFTNLELLSSTEIPATLISALRKCHVDEFITYEDYINQEDNGG